MRGFVLVLVVLAGLGVVATCAFYGLQDWAALNREYARFEQLCNSAAELRSLFIANAHRQAFRMNCFADGLGFLLGALIVAVGLHGLCTMSRGVSVGGRP